MEKLISANISGIRWRHPGVTARLAEGLAGDWGEARKANRVRKVFFLPATPHRPALVVKEYAEIGPSAMFRHLLAGSPAKREWRALEALQKAGVPSPQLVALGRRSVFSLPYRSYLATLSIEESCTLEDLLLGKEALPIPAKTLAANTGQLIRQMHDAGIQHRDLHAANILVDRLGAVYILDLHRSRFVKNLSLQKRYADLLAFSGAFLMHGGKTHRLRFFKAYAKDLALPQRPVDFLRRLEKDAKERLYRFLVKFDQRALRPGNRIEAIHLHDLAGHGLRSAEARACMHRLGPHPLDTLEENGSLIHESAGTRVYSLMLEGCSFAVKVYHRPTLAQTLKRAIRGSRARRSWLNYHRLLFRGFRIPEPVLYLEESAFATSGRSFLVTKGDFNLPTLDRFMATADQTARIACRNKIARIVARLHLFFLRNRDLKAQNLLVGTDHEITFIDPDGIKPMHEVSLYTIARDLMRLNASFAPRSPISNTDRLRFLKTYMLHMGLPPSGLKSLWSEILMLTFDKWTRWKEKSLNQANFF